jgi:cell wall-associated NlpC family hydrolase
MSALVKTAGAVGVAALLASGGHAHLGRTHGGARAIAYAREQLGKPYQWGGIGPDSFDCSGLAMKAWRRAGVSIPRTSQDQWTRLPHVSRSQLRPGDLAFAAGADGTVTSPGHVVIYIGHGKVIQAYATGYPVEVSSLASVHAVGYADPGAS